MAAPFLRVVLPAVFAVALTVIWINRLIPFGQCTVRARAPDAELGAASIATALPGCLLEMSGVLLHPFILPFTLDCLAAVPLALLVTFRKCERNGLPWFSGAAYVATVAVVGIGPGVPLLLTSFVSWASIELVSADHPTRNVNPLMATAGAAPLQGALSYAIAARLTTVAVALAWLASGAEGPFDASRLLHDQMLAAATLMDVAAASLALMLYVVGLLGKSARRSAVIAGTSVVFGFSAAWAFVELMEQRREDMEAKRDAAKDKPAEAKKEK